MADLARFRDRIERAKRAILESSLKESLIVHHDEADGLCSAAITKLALEKLGLATRFICLDKLHPEVVKDIEAGPQRLIAYSDIGSGHIEWLSNWNSSKNTILVLDHHDTVELPSNPLVHNLNPELDGFFGEQDACSATVAYLFATSVDSLLEVLAPLALIGSNEIPGGIRGLNGVPLHDGETNRRVVTTPKGSLKLDISGTTLSRDRATAILNVLGSVGYYRNGPETEINACMTGFNQDVYGKPSF